MITSVFVPGHNILNRNKIISEFSFEVVIKSGKGLDFLFIFSYSFYCRLGICCMMVNCFGQNRAIVFLGE
jgi:hypothetical protein